MNHENEEKRWDYQDEESEEVWNVSSTAVQEKSETTYRGRDGQEGWLVGNKEAMRETASGLTR